MNTNQLHYALKNNSVTKSYFCGIYSYDTLSLIKRKPKLIICNTDPSYKSGEHWVLFFFNKFSVEFFDPLGKDLNYYGINFVIFVKKFVNYYISNGRVQPIKSSLCGKYCLYYAFLRCKGYSMKQIMDIFPSYEIVIMCVNKKFYL
jgi:hypothetical protein